MTAVLKYVHINKFRFSKKATKFETISHMIWRLPSEIVSNFVAFLENLNFTPYSREQKHVSIKNPILLLLNLNSNSNMGSEK